MCLIKSWFQSDTHLQISDIWNKQNKWLQLTNSCHPSHQLYFPELLITNGPNGYWSDGVPLQVYSSMEHLSQLEQKATTSVSRREHKGPREDKVTKRESLGSFSMRDKSWRTGSPEMWVVGFIERMLWGACLWFLFGSEVACLPQIALCHMVPRRLFFSSSLF